MNSLIKRVLIQQFIPMDQIDHKIYDIRLYVQKNEQGKWLVTGGFSRVSNETSFITNITTELKSLYDILQSENLLSVCKLKEMETLSIQIAQELENELGHLGELSTDFGLDHKGKPWLIEVNGQPQKNIVARINNPKLTRVLYTMPFKYARSLATNQIR